MPREIEPSSNEKQFILQALQENLRLDGRAFDQFRDLEISFADDYGVVNVALGNTKCAIFTLFHRTNADIYVLEF